MMLDVMLVFVSPNMSVLMKYLPFLRCPWCVVLDKKPGAHTEWLKIEYWNEQLHTMCSSST